MATSPTTAAEIQTELNNIETLIKSILDTPAKFAELTGGSVKISMPEYIKALEVRQKYLRERLAKVPYWIGQDFEGTV